MVWREIAEESTERVARWTELPGDAQTAWLRCPPNASAAEVRAAYRSLARRLHPDAVPPHERAAAGQRMAALNAEYRAWTERQGHPR